MRKEKDDSTPNETAPGVGSDDKSEKKEDTTLSEVETKSTTGVTSFKADAFPIVGIGASAGGLAAFEAFFSGMPLNTKPGMAFVLVQHLAPDHKSILSDLIRRYTTMDVSEVEDGMVVKPNCAYIIPPNRDMAFLNGSLHLLEPSSPRGQRMPIDFFFRSLAQDQHERAIGIVLSGTGSDGTLGIRAIKGEGGMVMVQDPASLEYDGMPRSAISTDLIDFILQPSQMPAQLISYATRALNRPSPLLVSEPKIENALRKIFILIRSQTGHDFSLYKPNTIQRRIERRMAVHQISDIEEYVKYLQRAPLEVGAIFRDLLIGVTNFFRDPVAFKTLEEMVIPHLFTGKTSSDIIRVWSVGCSTGEEAYSLAILLAERQEAMKRSFKVQVFATDIDSLAITTARAGVYPASIAADVSPERLAQYFEFDPSGNTYRIHKGIRDMLVFSEQDLIRDPPFSKIDLICCRNVLIYMGIELQRKIIPLFYYALNPDGILFLGSSETIGDKGDLFTAVDRKAKLYKRVSDFQGSRRSPLAKFISPMSAIDVAIPGTVNKAIGSWKLPLRELVEQALLQQIPLSGILVNAQGDILYLHGRTGQYLEFASGEPGINNVLKMAREGLRQDLVLALHKAVTTKDTVRHDRLRVKTNGHYSMVNLIVRPVAQDSNTKVSDLIFLVILEEEIITNIEEYNKNAAIDKEENILNADSHIIALKQELRAKEEYLQAANEELETANEELKSTNEEMQSVNEELQSTNEELETSKEELQSLNEEMSTVNFELQSNITDMTRLNNDMNNLLAGTGIATVFVDHKLSLLRFTPQATRILNLINSDIGRPIGHIVSNLVDYKDFLTDIKVVLDTLITKEAEVQGTDGKWYKMRILPYRTIDNVIEGAVITFMDISEMKSKETLILSDNTRLRLAAFTYQAADAIIVQAFDGQILGWNLGAERFYGWSEVEALNMNISNLIQEESRVEVMAKINQMSQSDTLECYQTKRVTKDGKVLGVTIIATPLINESGQRYAIATTERMKKI